MAKKNQVFIDIVIDDKGTTKRVAVNAKKLGLELDKAGAGADRVAQGQDKASKSAKDLDRNMRGTAKMTSNGTKEFSKMSQGMGGLVGAYATLAAQVFAVTAAFQFLSRASEVTNLMEGQRAMGAVTGVAYQTITQRIIEATDAQLKYGDAARAAAIGTAAGLQAAQLTELATAAKNASFALGRDLTDSFNRLIRGVTKAEPELLDELGIILRLETATEKYAQSIGKARTDLNEFERTQAVTNDVLEQAQRKFAAIEAMMDPNAAALSQFAKSFDDLVRGFSEMLITGLRPVLQFLSENTAALTAALTLFALPIIKAILPSLDEWEASTKKLAKRNVGFFNAYKKGLNEAGAELKTFAKTQEEIEKQATKKARKVLKGSESSAGLDYLRGEGESGDRRKQAAARRIIDNALKQTKEGKIAETGFLAGKNREQVLDVQKSYDARVNAAKAANKKTMLSFAFMGKFVKATSIGIGTVWRGVMAGMAMAARGAAIAINFAFSAVAIIGVITLIIQAGKAVKDFFFPLSKEALRQKDIIDDLSGKYEKLTGEMQRARKARDTLISGADRQINQGNIVGSVNISELMSDIGELNTLDKSSEAYKDLRKELLGTVLELARIDKGFAKLYTDLKKGGPITAKTAKETKNLANEYKKLGADLANVPNLIKAANTAFSKLGEGVKNTPLSNVVDETSKAIEGLDLRIENHFKTSNDLIDEMVEGSRLLHAYNEQMNTLSDQQQKVLRGDMGVYRKQNLIKRKQLYDFEADAAFRTNEELEKMLVLQRDSIELAKADMEAQKRLQDIYDEALRREEKILRVRKELLVTQEIDAYRRAIGNDVYAKTINLDEERNKIQAKIVRAQENIEAAEIRVKFATDKTRDSAKENLQFARQQLFTTQAEAAFSEKVLDDKEKRLKTEKEILAITTRRITAEQQSSALKRALQFEEAIGGGTDASIERQRFLNRQLLFMAVEGAEAQVEAREKIFADAEERIRNNVLRSMGDLGKFIVDTETGTNYFERGAEYEQNVQSALTASPEGQALQGAQNQLESAKNLLSIEQNKDLAFQNQNQSLVEQAQKQLDLVGITQAHVLFNERILAAKQQGIPLSQSELELLEQQAIQTTMLAAIAQEKQSLFFSIGDSISGAFTSIIDGSMSAKDAFKQMAKSIIADIISMIVRLTVMRALMSVFGFGGIPTDMGLPMGTGQSFAGYARQGGILDGYRYGGKVKNYAAGGVARGSDNGHLAVLHGREAVVPLPSGDKIPVDLQGTGGQQNNVTVNVAVNNDGTAGSADVQGTTSSASNLGRSIAKAVQDELIEQKRAGGILNPYGVA